MAQAAAEAAVGDGGGVLDVDALGEVLEAGVGSGGGAGCEGGGFVSAGGMGGEGVGRCTVCWWRVSWSGEGGGVEEEGCGEPEEGGGAHPVDCC